MRLPLEVLFLTDKGDLLEKSKVTSNDYFIKHMIFYSIDNIEPIDDKMCMVSSGGYAYRVPLKMQEVDRRIMKQREIYGAN